MADNFKYPLPKFHFRVEWGGAVIGFTKASGLDKDDKKHPPKKKKKKVKMPGMQKFPNITLKRGAFIAGARSGMITFTKSDLFISLINEEGTTISKWKLKNARPLKIKATDLKVEGNEIAIETIEISHEGLCLVDC